MLFKSVSIPDKYTPEMSSTVGPTVLNIGSESLSKKEVCKESIYIKLKLRICNQYHVFERTIICYEKMTYTLPQMTRVFALKGWLEVTLNVTTGLTVKRLNKNCFTLVAYFNSELHVLLLLIAVVRIMPKLMKAVLHCSYCLISEPK